MLITLIASRPERNEDNCDDAVDIHPNGPPASAMGCTDQSVIKKGLVEVAKIKTVLAEIGQTLRLVPHDFHRLYCRYNIT